MNTCLTVSLVLLSFFQAAPGCNRPSRPPPPCPTPPSAPGNYQCRCGTPQVNRNRIVGGQAASKNEYPWQVLLSGPGLCGGTLLSTRTVLTAAHCYEDRFVHKFMIHVQEHDRSRCDGEQKIRPQSFAIHPQYNANTNDNDLAIIQLSRDVKFSNTIMPICLPDPNTNYDNQVSTVTGWGHLKEGGSSPNILQEVDVDTITNGACKLVYGYGSRITNNMICAIAPGKDACQSTLYISPEILT